MRHRKAGRKLGRTSSHKKALLRTLASELFEHKRIHTTLAKAKELRPYSEKIITRAKKALDREQQGLLSEGQTIDVHARRVVYKDIKKKHVLELLFDEIAPAVMDRNGGYTRIVKTGRRRGDGGETALIELVDWNTDQDSSFVKKKHVKKASTKTQAGQEKSSAKSEDAVPAAEVEEDNVAEETTAADNTEANEEDTAATAETTSSEEIIEEKTGELENADTDADTEKSESMEAAEEIEPVGVSNESDFEEVIASNDASEDSATEESNEDSSSDEEEEKKD